MPSFLARRKKTKIKRPISFKTRSGKTVSLRQEENQKEDTELSFS